MRPQGAPRLALEKVLHAGGSGTSEALALQAGVDATKALDAIRGMQRAGLVVARSAPLQGGHAKKGRPRVIYTLATRATRAAHARELDRILSGWRGVIQPDGIGG